MWRLLTAVIAMALPAQSACGSCTQSGFIPGGFVLPPAAGVEVHYALTEPGLVTFGLRANTTGFVGLAIVPPSQESPYPSDGVVGWGGASRVVMPYAIDGPQRNQVLGSGVVLMNVSAYEHEYQNGRYAETGFFFTRRLRAGRFPIDPVNVTMYMFRGPTDGYTNVTLMERTSIRMCTVAGLLPERQMPPNKNGAQIMVFSPVVAVLSLLLFGTTL